MVENHVDTNLNGEKEDGDKKSTGLPPPWDTVFPMATRLTVWTILAVAIYILRSFFLLVFLTFVFAYIQSSGEKRLEPYIRSRTLRVVLVLILFLTFLTSVSIFVLPKVQRQAEGFVKNFSAYIGKVDTILIGMSNKYPILYQFIPELRQAKTPSGTENGTNEKPLTDKGKETDIKKSPTLSFLQDMVGIDEKSEGLEKIDQVLGILGGIGSRFAAISSAFLLSLLLSFLIVFDLPQLRSKVQDLRNTKLSFIYEEVAENIYHFSHVLGQALQAQFYIALANTILTAIGLYMLSLGKQVAFLSVIVFFCSFIPVAGVFISSVPICLIAIQAPEGLQTMFLAIIMIIIIHLIEGYILNPRIYGYRMHINPVIVLIILTIGGKLFHFWGLILGVPVFSYFFDHAIRYKASLGEKKVLDKTME